MQKAKIGNWEIEFDKSSTEKVYEKLNTIENECSCQICENYSKAVLSFPEEVVTFLKELGVDYTKPREVYEYEYKNGFVHYGGYYHIVGNYISGVDIHQPTKIFSKTKFEYYEIIENFEIAFTRDIDLLPDFFLDPALQIEINFIVPWVLSKPYDDTPIEIE